MNNKGIDIFELLDRIAKIRTELDNLYSYVSNFIETEKIDIDYYQ